MPKAMLLKPKPIFDAESHVVEAEAKMRQKEIMAAPAAFVSKEEEGEEEEELSCNVFKKIDVKSHVVEAEAKMRQQEILAASAPVRNFSKSKR
jgi:hypothetical protein